MGTDKIVAALQATTQSGRARLSGALRRMYTIPRERALIGSVIVFCVLALIDLSTPPQLELSFLYVPLIAIVTWNCGSREGFVLALFAFLIQVIDRQLPGGHTHTEQYSYLALLNRLCFFLIIVALLHPLRRMYTVVSNAASLDSLTSIPNRQMFKNMLQAEIARQGRHRRHFAVAYVDCDNFKQVNDGSGHAVGDKLLCTVATATSDSLRAADVIARIGGDEFALLLPETSEKQAKQVIVRVKDNLTEQMRCNDWPVTFSIGMLCVDGPADSVDEIIRLCDMLMYRIKHGKKDGIAVERLSRAREALM